MSNKFTRAVAHVWTGESVSTLEALGFILSSIIIILGLLMAATVVWKLTNGWAAYAVFAFPVWYAFHIMRHYGGE